MRSMERQGGEESGASPIVTRDPTRLTTVKRIDKALEALFSEKSPSTVLAYRADLMRFARWLGEPDTAHAAARLFALPRGEANELVLDYRKEQQARCQAPTINRSLAAIRSLMRVGRLLGVVDYTLDVPDLRVRRENKRKGPSVAEVRQSLRASEEGVCAALSSLKLARDHAILRLLTDLGLRRGSVCSLDMEHVDLKTHELDLQLKGRKKRELFTLPGPTEKALRGWLELRGDAPGPVFFGLHPATKRARLTGKSVWEIIRAAARTHPHGLRHAAITAVLKTTKSLHTAMNFARHDDPRTTALYDDSKRESGDEAARALASLFDEKPDSFT